MSSCAECGGNTSWDEHVCSTICTSCGTLQDPSQSLLASHIDQHDNSARQYDDTLWCPSTTLKSIRAAGWNLTGQGKEARDSKNTVHIIY
jgi:transcription factor IIIB 90 kDa subunit